MQRRRKTTFELVRFSECTSELQIQNTVEAVPGDVLTECTCEPIYITGFFSLSADRFDLQCTDYNTFRAMPADCYYDSI